MITVDLVIINANIITLDEGNNYKKSLAITDGRVSGLWEESEPPHGILNMQDSQVIDARGTCIIPGFIDTHNHLLTYSMTKNQIDCSTFQNKSIQDIIDKIHVEVQKVEGEQWIQGYGYDDTSLDERRHPTKEDLDKVSPNHPVLLTHITGHFGVANSKALEFAGITEESIDPQNTFYGRSKQGFLNGVFYEISALETVSKMIPALTIDELVDTIEAGAQDYLAQGITSNTDALVGELADQADLYAHILAAKSGANPMRTELMLMDTMLEGEGIFSTYTAKEVFHKVSTLSAGKARVNSAKVFQDGAIQGYTGALRNGYYQTPNTFGELIHEQQYLNEKILNLHKRGFRVATHGNGDRAIGSILEAYEYALRKHPRNDHRHRIEHVQTATREDIDSMKRLNVAGSVFINHVYFWGDLHKDLFLGPERASRISPLGSMRDENILFTLHSDCPVTPISPLFSVWAAVNRMTASGEVLGVDERIDVVTALKAMTIYGSKLNFTEKDSGSIEIGKYADLVWLDKDPTAIDSIYIKDIEIEATMIAGIFVYQQK